jgi:acyl carrier protein
MTDQDVTRIVTNAWRSVFGLDEITDADFFRLGGDSLTAVRLARQVESALPIKFPLHVLLLDGRLGPIVAECEQAVRLAENERQAEDGKRPG